MPWLQGQHGNPTSRHVFGRNAREAIELARKQVAQAVGVQGSQVVLTSGGTEANNFAIKGLAANLSPAQCLVSAIEHPCVSKPAEKLAHSGWRTAKIAVDANGAVDLDKLAEQLKTETNLMSVMLVNNETGAIQPVADITKLAKQNGAWLHTDAVQALGKIEVDFHALGAHAMTLSAHKIGGPIGVGALVLDKRVDIAPLLDGGGQERGLRSGTENIAAIVGFGKACELANQNVSQWQTHTQALRNRLESGLTALEATVFGQTATRVANTSFFAIPNIEGETLVTALDKAGYAVASGSACSSDSTEPSHVLLAMGIEPDLARGAIRVSLGEHNTQADIDGFLQALTQEVQRLRNMTAIAA